MRDLVVRAHHKRFEIVPRIQTGRAAGLFALARVVAGKFLARNLGQLFLFLFVRAVRSGDKLHFARRTKCGHDRGLQCGHVITFDPKLVDVVWNAKSKRLIGRLDELYGGKPALESVGTNLRLEGCRQFLP